MEYFRQGRSLAVHREVLECRISILNTRIKRFSRRSERASSIHDKLQWQRRVERTGGSVDRILDNIAEIDDAQDAGIFIFPDGTRTEQLHSLTVNFLTHLPVSSYQAVSLDELAYQRFQKEIDRGHVKPQDALQETQLRLSGVQQTVQESGWEIKNASEGEIDEQGRPAEARYYLYSQAYAERAWLPKRLRPEVPEPEPQETQVLIQGQHEEVQSESEGDGEPKQVEVEHENETSGHEELTVQQEDEERPYVGVIVQDANSREVTIIPHATLEQNRLHALSRMDRYVNSPGEQEYLREHQQDTMVKVRDHFASGKASGAIVLFTSAGKTYVAGELAREIGLPTIIFAPNEDVFRQNGKTLAQLCRGMTVTNYSGKKKDISGDVVNTLYQSLPSMTRRGVDLSRFGLVIYDEADLSLGEQRHKMHEMFPNAIKIALTATLVTDQLEGYKERGLIKGDEEWLETFTNIIHEVPEEEALLKGAIPPQEFILVSTGVDVYDVPRGVNGDVNANRIARQLSVGSRDALGIAILAGLENLPPGFEVPPEKRGEVTRYHERVKGRRTLVHGFGVDYIKDRAKLLNSLGISAKAIYGGMEEDRQKVIDQVISGEVQVLLGDELTGRGLDIPPLEAAIYLVPSLSARDLAQRKGRLYRHSPETGKTAGIHIQLVDNYRVSRSQQPILLTSFYEPDFVLRGLSKGREKGRSGRTWTRVNSPIMIEGSINLNAYFEEVRLQDLISKRFVGASLDKINETVVDLYEKIASQSHPDIVLADVYFELANLLPARNRAEVNNQVLDGVISDDPKTKSIAIQALLLINVKSVLAAVQPYLKSDREYDNKLFQEVFLRFTEQAARFHNKYSIALQINSYARRVAMQFVAQEEGVPVGWVQRGIYVGILEDTDTLFREFPDGLDKQKLDEYAGQIAEKYQRPVSTVKQFLASQNDRLLLLYNDSDVNIAYTTDHKREIITEALATLTERERRVIEMRMLDGEKGKTLEETAREFEVTRERVRQIEAKALRKLRHPSRSKKLWDLLD